MRRAAKEKAIKALVEESDKVSQEIENRECGAIVDHCPDAEECHCRHLHSQIRHIGKKIENLEVLKAIE